MIHMVMNTVEYCREGMVRGAGAARRGAWSVGGVRPPAEVPRSRGVGGRPQRGLVCM